MNNLYMEHFKPLLKQCKEHILTSKEGLIIEEKEDSDLVTNLDLEIETMIIAFIKTHYPKDLIISEETSIETLTDEPTWVIDPIDGTVNFSYGSKLYGIQLCKMVNKIAVFTILYLPEMDDLFYASKGEGAYRNDKPLFADTQHAIRLSQVSFGDFSKSCYESRPYEMKLIDTLKEEALNIRIFGSSCMDFTALASGQTHCHIMFSKRIWEFYAGLLLCEEARLVTEQIQIKNTDITAICAAHNPKMLTRVKEILSHA